MQEVSGTPVKLDSGRVSNTRQAFADEFKNKEEQDRISSYSNPLQQLFYHKEHKKYLPHFH
jgi:hypothetical protein